jgi:hypothetical protein
VATQWLSGLELSLFVRRFSWRSATTRLAGQGVAVRALETKTCLASVVAIVQDGGDCRSDDAPMKNDTTFSPIAVGLASRQPLHRLLDILLAAARALALRWQRAQWDEATRYLNDAVDHGDLERRQRALERGLGRPPC